MKQSIQTKITKLTAVGILVTALLIGGLGIYTFRRAMNEDCEDILHLTCGESAQALDEWFVRVEQSVETLANYAQNSLESLERLAADKAYRETYVQELKDLALMLADETDGAVSVYIRFNPDLTTPLDGVFWVQQGAQREFLEFPMTDLSAFDPDDFQHVGWYYVPVRAGHAIWVEPYMNEEMGVYVTSYVVPIYRDGTLIGVVGMDIDFSYITEMVDEIRVYETGHAFLADSELCVIYSHHRQKGEKVDMQMDAELPENADFEELIFEHEDESVRQKLVFQSLENDMRLGVTVPVYEVNKDINHLVSQVVGIALLIVGIFIAISITIAEKMTRPLKELNAAAKEIAAGNLDVSVSCDTQDEVSDLAESFAETARQLKIRIDYINSLAFVDKLTGVKNNTAYLQEIAQWKERMKSGDVNFAVFVIDVNGLKKVNDTLGHASGNELIIKTAEAAVAVFGKDRVFRIGGDEFAVICPDTDAAACAALEPIFEETVERMGKSIQLSAAIGSAVCDPKKDISYDAVFERADAEMYRRKQEFKSGVSAR
ncbi:MAG: diguanylate cyclase [Oscillospiraceae bacterium]|nr:diguanylate cyclase [Oscillospiraceae bacterium]